MTNPHKDEGPADDLGNRRQLRALIVEDEILIAWELQSTLEEIGIHVDEFVSNGSKALELVESRPFEVLFMDVNLVGSPDGTETARRIRERFDTPIVFVTAYAGYDRVYNDLRQIDRSVVVGKPATLAAIKGALYQLGLLPRRQ
jgi:CheY-like chemotaxis protein